ncbi:MAG: glycosyltransferase family 39 protein [Anaerolineales bacterium]|nr:glycosyltransferase family 39 protein [Anaerolineales bacterium]
MSQCARWLSIDSSIKVAYRPLLAAITLAGFFLRLQLLDRFPFREDEAIYGYWALHGWRVDPWFLTVWPDKPPLFIWLLGSAFQLWGAVPAAAQFLNIAASTLTIAVVAATARRWWGPLAGLTAGALLMLNPFAISFAATAYTDSTLVLAGALSLACVAGRRPILAGLWLGVAIMTKQQGLLFAPLIVVVLLVPPHAEAGSGQGARHTIAALKALARFCAGLALITLPILYLDSLRWAVAPSPWDLGARNAGTVLLASAATWQTRLYGWLALAWQLAAAPAPWLIWSILLLGAVWFARRGDQGRNLAIACWLALWSVAFLILHTVTSVQVWDRYLLPLVLPYSLLGGWAVQQGWNYLAPRAVNIPAGALRAGLAVACGLVVLLWLPPAARAATGNLPIGADHGAYAGLDVALAYAQSTGRGDQRVELYHREVGWQARFYLFDAIQNGAVELRYYPNAVYLADSVVKHPHKRNLLIMPDWAPVRDLDLQLANRRLAAHEEMRTGHFIVYSLNAIDAGDAAWRVCRPAPAWEFIGASAAQACSELRP